MQSLSAGLVGRGIGYGMYTRYNDFTKVQQMDFGWVKIIVSWAGMQPVPGVAPNFQAPPGRLRGSSPGVADTAIDFSIEALVNAARSRGLQVLLRVDDTPAWAKTHGCPGYNSPPADDQHLANFMYEVALHFKERVTAYEIWNEPNLLDEWGNCNPDPAKYVRMLGALYPKVKQADREAVVVAGGLSNTAEGSIPGQCGASVPIWGDLCYLQYMYLSGGRMGTHWDVLGAHPYGGPNPPDADPYSSPPTGLYFRRMDNMRDIIRDFGGNENVPIWPTEVGWVTDFDRGCYLEAREPQKVSLARHGDYLRDAYFYAAQQMPWMGPMFIFNLDANVGMPPNCELGDFFRWFSILRENGDGSLPYAYAKLQTMAKASTTLQSNRTSLLALAEPGGPPVTRTLTLTNHGGWEATWTALSSDPSWLNVTSTSGSVLSWHQATLALTLTPSATPGTKTATVTISGPRFASITVTVTLVTANLFRSYLPIVTQAQSGM